MKTKTTIWWRETEKQNPVPFHVPPGSDVRLSAILIANLSQLPVIISWSKNHAETILPATNFWDD